MSNRATTGWRARIVILTVATGIATCLPLGGAEAQGRGNDRHDSRGHDNGRGHESRQHDWQREHWRNGYRGNGREYYRRPDVYYSAPPVVILPPRYYAPPPPGLSLQFGFPLYY